jgi:prevent-host-death family protein
MALSRFINTNELRDNLSETINRAAFGKEAVIVTRRGRKIAVIISIGDLIIRGDGGEDAG